MLCNLYVCFVTVSGTFRVFNQTSARILPSRSQTRVGPCFITYADLELYLRKQLQVENRKNIYFSLIYISSTLTLKQFSKRAVV